MFYEAQTIGFIEYHQAVLETNNRIRKPSDPNRIRNFAIPMKFIGNVLLNTEGLTDSPLDVPSGQST